MRDMGIPRARVNRTLPSPERLIQQVFMVLPEMYTTETVINAGAVAD